MKPLVFSMTLILSSLTLFTTPNVYSGGCSKHMDKKAEVECLPTDKKCLDTKNKETLNKLEA